MREQIENTYDAFISYRHSELDMFVAEQLHRQLESFRLSGKVVKEKKLKKYKIDRFFRDKDELLLATDLSSLITKALQVSEFLIVICTPRLPESLWCRREIETFVELHGRGGILPVLAEGEPNESFPDVLC